MGECVTIKNLLEVYHRASRQEVNFTKSSIRFSKNVPVDLRIAICDELNMTEEMIVPNI